MLRRLRVAGYRSVRDLALDLAPVTVLVGPNGCGKTNLYQAARLRQQAAAGRLARALADEGGMPSALWAGPRPRGPVRMTVEATWDEWTWRLVLGLPQDPTSMFHLDPEVKEEALEIPVPGRKTPLRLLDRGRGSATARDEEGVAHTFPFALPIGESALSQISEPKRFPELHTLRETFLRWRFVHQIRTDPEAPARQPQVPVRTLRMADDGRDLACALQTIRENGDDEALDQAIALAFPGCGLRIADQGGRLHLAWSSPGLLRPLDARELSDGTLRFLALAAALLSPQPPPLLALNEPETSLHPTVIPALAGLIARASQQAQLWVTTHSRALAEAIDERTPATVLRLARDAGATVLAS